jgi:hypothetical protein
LDLSKHLGRGGRTQCPRHHLQWLDARLAIPERKLQPSLGGARSHWGLGGEQHDTQRNRLGYYSYTCTAPLTQDNSATALCVAQAVSMPGSSITASNCTFAKCTAEGSYRVKGGVVHIVDGGATAFSQCRFVDVDLGWIMGMASVAYNQGADAAKAAQLGSTVLCRGVPVR